MGKMVSEIERAKLSMIIESERMLSESERGDSSKFPNFIMLRRQAEVASDGSTGIDAGQ